jgi:hypothetical protein
MEVPSCRNAAAVRVFHDTRHSSVTNLVASGTGEAAAMSITSHTNPAVFKRHSVRRDAVQAEAAKRRAPISPPSAARRQPCRRSR